MRKAAARRLAFTLSTEGITRLLISSYFVGLGLGLIDGADVGVLARPFLSLPASEIVSGTVVVVLALMVLFGVQRRPSALLLSVVVFWASYVTMVIQSGDDHIGAFWRDLALIGALLLTYGDARSSVTFDISSAFRSISGRVRSQGPAGEAGTKGEKGEVASRSNSRSPSVMMHSKRGKTELYREDFEVVRVS